MFLGAKVILHREVSIGLVRNVMCIVILVGPKGKLTLLSAQQGQDFSVPHVHCCSCRPKQGF